MERLLDPVQVHWSAIVRFFVMAAVVATLWFPVAAILAGLASVLLDFPIRIVVTFGDRVHAAIGLVLCWLIVLLPALGYAAVFMPSWGKATTGPD
ncbi:hypothetical protein AYO46_09045 [Betaproteobacteria bacterium SCGC AG-212-J23]|nr:hypothetical protein AYO46_09045 [Betaproteobacteria bacterium SCGC AG-212-J23]